MTLLILTLKTTMVKRSIKNLVFVNKGNIVDKIDNSTSKIGKAKFKNIIMHNFLAKSKSLVKPSSGLDFLTSKIRLALAKLK